MGEHTEMDQVINLVRHTHTVKQLMIMCHESGDMMAVLQRHVYDGADLDKVNLTSRMLKLENAIKELRLLVGNGE